MESCRLKLSEALWILHEFSCNFRQLKAPYDYTHRVLPSSIAVETSGAIELDQVGEGAYIPFLMVDPVRALLLEIETEIDRLPGAALSGPATGAAAGAARDERWKELFGRVPPPGFAAFVDRHDGGVLSSDVRLLSWDESLRRLREADRAGDGSSGLKGLWPVLERGDRLFALDAEAAGESEWPVVEVADRSVDRAGSSFLRFLHALLAELLAPDSVDRALLVRTLCRRDPGLAAHWVELADHLEEQGRDGEIDDILEQGIRSAAPAGPSLVFAIALRALERDDVQRAAAAIDDAMSLDPLTARDDDARLDAAAVSLLLALDRGDQAAAARAREVLGPAASSTGAYWRGEALRAWVEGPPKRAELAARIVAVLLPEDTDIARMQPPNAALVTALKAMNDARDALDRGDADEAVQKARIATTERPDLGLSYAVLAEAMNARRDRGALETAQKAADLNPALVEAWRELGDAYLEGRQAVKAEEAYRKALARDSTYGFGLAKLAQALLEQGRTLEALDSINGATERGGDPFFLAAVRGDILAEMSRHREAAEAYDQALRMEPDDHWVLHQAAIEHSRAGNDDRAAELFERALDHDREGCHQTLIDYGDLLRRVGRIGDAVRLYRRAVAACPSDTEWRQTLREAERELMSAPN
jgi:tetratricopeptide (TPR) repeat protein